MLAGDSGDLEQGRRLERGLVWVRWFAIVLGIYLVSQTNAAPPPHASWRVLVWAQVSLGLLAISNVFIWLGSHRAKTLRTLHTVGAAAFACDATVIFAMAWLFSYNPKDTTWVVIFILPLEGAIRYRLEGALVTVAVTLVNEMAREAYIAARFPRLPFLVANVAFRVGIDAIIALVAGFTSRSLAQEARNAAREAARFEEAARREAGARRELAAFNTAILTGVAAEDLDTSLQLMAAAIGRDLGYESLTILLREGDDLVVRGMYGMPFYEDRIPLGKGVTGTVAATGRPLIVPDVSRFEGYIVADPSMRSEMAAPMQVGQAVIGVLDVESRSLGAFNDATLGTLTRLADQIALVTHSNLLLSQQRETVERLQELDEMKSDFVAITSHELRTPITAIRGFVKTLVRSKDRLSDEQLRDFMDRIDRQSARLARLVDDLLVVSRIEAGTLRLAVEEVDLSSFLKDTLDAFDETARSRIRVETEPGLGTAMMDPLRLDQIIRNLVENALKFSPPETDVTVAARMVDGSMELSVTDRGIGIAEEDLPYVFDRFHQAGSVLTRESEGAGLGLYITKRLVEAMGGRIDAQSSPREGSTFRVVLPRRATPSPRPRVGVRLS